jgi:hypothetical protein
MAFITLPAALGGTIRALLFSAAPYAGAAFLGVMLAMAFTVTP